MPLQVQDIGSCSMILCKLLAMTQATVNHDVRGLPSIAYATDAGIGTRPVYLAGDPAAIARSFEKRIQKRLCPAPAICRRCGAFNPAQCIRFPVKLDLLTCQSAPDTGRVVARRRRRIQGETRSRHQAKNKTGSAKAHDM